MKIFSFASLVICYEQPKYSDFVKALSRKKSGWGHPVDRIAALYTLCSPLETPTNGQVTCDQSTCALVCDQGLNPFFLNREKHDFRIRGDRKAPHKMPLQPAQSLFLEADSRRLRNLPDRSRSATYWRVRHVRHQRAESKKVPLQMRKWRETAVFDRRSASVFRDLRLSALERQNLRLACQKTRRHDFRC